MREMSILSTPVEIFCSFADEDAPLLKLLEGHLSVLLRDGRIMLWHRQKIASGRNQQIELDQHLNIAPLILLLISPSFFESDYCYHVEMQRAMQRYEAGEVRVIPLLLRPIADWQRAPFGKLKALPGNGVPITCWSNQDEAFVDVAQGIQATLDDMQHISSSSTFSEFENLPYWPDEYFTGRDQELEYLHIQLHQRSATNIGQIQAISGLGGIGKTALAVEYAYRYNSDYSWSLFARADSIEALTSSYIKIATYLDLPQKDAQEQRVIVQAVKTWLKTQKRYLLILDNANELNLLDDFVPSDAKGHFLITTRAADPRTLKLGIVNSLPLKGFSEEQGIDFLCRRASLCEIDSHEQVRQLVRELDGLPLALNCAGTYLCNTKDSMDNYLKLYQEQGSLLLNECDVDGYSKPFTTTWTISFQVASANNPDVVNLFYLCAFLAPDAIPEAILIEGAKALGPAFTPIADAHRFNLAIKDLRAYSLIDRYNGTLTMHRLVQDVSQRNLPSQEVQRWKRYAIQSVCATLPNLEHTHWNDCERWLPHTFVCAQWIIDEKDSFFVAPRLLNWAGQYLRERARYNESERFLQQSHALNEPSYRTVSQAEITDLSELAFLSWCQGTYRKAEMWLLRALAIYKGRLSYEGLSSDERQQYATCLQNLACIYQTQGKYEDSKKQFQQASEQVDGAIIQSNLAELYRRLGKYEEADLLLKQAIRTYEQEREHEELYTAYLFHKQALLSFDRGRYTEAELLFVHTQTIYEKYLGREHPHTAQILHGLAEVYRIQDKYDESEKSFQCALVILEKMLGQEHSATAAALNGLALLYLEQGKKQGKYIYVKQERCMKLGKYGEAEELFQRALHIREGKLGKEHPDTALILYNLALLYYDQGKYEEAEEHIKRAQMIWQQQLSLRHPYIIYILYHLGLLYQAQKRDKEAEALFQRARVIFEEYEKELKNPHPIFAYTLNSLALLYHEQGNYEEAGLFYERALKIFEQNLQDIHPDKVGLLSNFADLYYRQGKYEKAEPLLKRALLSYRQTAGVTDPYTQDLQKGYDTLLQILGHDEDGRESERDI